MSFETPSGMSRRHFMGHMATGAMAVIAGPLGQKTYACFVRRYDASHLAQHPKQKVSAMKLLVFQMMVRQIAAR